jgi:hypothetical protein
VTTDTDSTSTPTTLPILFETTRASSWPVARCRFRAVSPRTQSRAARARLESGDEVRPGGSAVESLSLGALTKRPASRSPRTQSR